MEIPVLDAVGLGVDPGSVGAAGARVRRDDYFVPPAVAGAEMLEGSVDELATKVAELLKAKGGIK